MRKIFYIIILCFLSIHILSIDVKADQQHTVKKGESLYRIAKNYSVSVNQLKKANNIKGTRIQPGDLITIPTKPAIKKQKQVNLAKHHINTKQREVDLTTYKVKKGENLYRISSKFGLTAEELKRINSLSGNNIKIGQILRVPSVHNKSTSDSKPQSGEDVSGHEVETDVPEVIEEVTPGDAVASVNKGKETNQAAAENGMESEAKVLTENEEAEIAQPEKKESWFSVIETAMDYIGVPYKFGGTTLKGIDCSAFVQMVYSYFSIELPRTAREQFKAGVKVSKKELRIGDLIFFRTYARFPSHVGIYIGEGKMVHASSRGKKVTVSSINEPYYVKRYIGAIRLPENPTRISTEDLKI